jgi:tetratricopeptide (TPR) repeat protein
LSKSNALISAAVFLVAFGVKFGYLHERASRPDFTHPTLDSQYHDEWAWAISSGEWKGRMAEVKDQPYFRAPLYAYFVAAVHKLGGRDYFLIRLVQVVIGALSAVLVYRLAWLLFAAAVGGKTVGWIAFLLYLCYWPITYFEAELLIPVLIVFLDLLGVILIIEAARTRRVFPWLLSGFVLGLSAIARPNILIVIPFVLFWIWKRMSNASVKARAMTALLFVSAWVAVIVPVTIRNAAVGHDFVPIASQGGVNFFIGNNPESDGVRAVVPGTRADWWGGFDDTRQIAQRDAGRELKPSEVSNYWFRRGLGYLIDQPADAAKLYMRKVGLFLGNGEISNNRQLYFIKGRSLVLSLLAVNFAVLLAFGVVGILLLKRDDAKRDPTESSVMLLERALPLHFIIPYAVSVLLFFITSRYRLPVAVLLVPYAAYGIQRIFDRFRRGQRRSAVIYSIVAMTVFIASIVNPFNVGGAMEARGFYSLGVDYSHNEYDKALEAFNQSIEQDPSFAPAWKMRGWVNYKLGRHADATEDLLESCRLDSNFVDAFYTLGVVYQVRDLHARAGPPYERAITLQPNHRDALTNLADVYMRRGDYDLALPLLERALDIDATFPNAVFGLGSYYEHVGRLEEALDQYRRVAHLPTGRLGLIRILVRAGRFDEADATLDAWRLSYPDAPEIEELARLVAQYRKQNPESKNRLDE